MQPKRIIFLMSDTGGGHRSAADAIRAALALRYPGHYVFELIDVYRRYTPFPFRFMPELYPSWVNWARPTWGLTYEFANARYRSNMAMGVVKRLWRDGMRRMVTEHPGDVIVCVHALFSRPVIDAYHRSHYFRPPVISIVTDLVSTHAFWYEKEVERCLVPTQAAYDRGRAFGLRADQLRITGLPVHPDFLQRLPQKTEARRQLGWKPHVPVVMLSSGSDGMGPLYRIARALDARRLPVQLVIVAGRNKLLRRRLENSRWQQPTYIYSFVTNMPLLMVASDVLVTKAGPATICEACVSGLPMVLSGAVPGQEDGNVAHVVENQAGEYAPSASQVADTVAAWIAEGPRGLLVRSRRARTLGRPSAVWDIADEIHAQAQRAPVRTRFQASVRQPRLRHAPEDDWVL